MASRKTRILLTTLIVILGTGMTGFIFWTSDTYRAATPLVFIVGAIILFIPALRTLAALFLTPEQRIAYQARRAAALAQKNERDFYHSGIPQLVTNLYFAHIQHYPEWIRVSRDYVPSSVTNAGLTEQGEVRILLYYRDYVFTHTHWRTGDNDSDDYQDGTLAVTCEGTVVLTLRITRAPGKKGIARWSPVAIESFTIGNWIRDFQNVKAEIIAIIKDRERDARES